MTDLVGGDEVADEDEHAHDGVLSDGDDVGAGDLEDLDALGDRGVEVDVVGADTCSHAELEVLGLGRGRQSDSLTPCYTAQRVPCQEAPWSDTLGGKAW